MSFEFNLPSLIPFELHYLSLIQLRVVFRLEFIDRMLIASNAVLFYRWLADRRGNAEAFGMWRCAHVPHRTEKLSALHAMRSRLQLWIGVCSSVSRNIGQCTVEEEAALDPEMHYFSIQALVVYIISMHWTFDSFCGWFWNLSIRSPKIETKTLSLVWRDSAVRTIRLCPRNVNRTCTYLKRHNVSAVHAPSLSLPTMLYS